MLHPLGAWENGGQEKASAKPSTKPWMGIEGNAKPALIKRLSTGMSYLEDHPI